VKTTEQGNKSTHNNTTKNRKIGSNKTNTDHTDQHGMHPSTFIKVNNNNGNSNNARNAAMNAIRVVIATKSPTAGNDRVKR
jgi:hypothetical protein